VSVGHTNNPQGRPLGSRNRRTEAIWRTLEEKGDLDPAVHLSSIVTDPSQPPELRAAAANYLLPYKYSKKGAVPPLRYIEESFTFPHPHPTTPQEVDANVAAINTAYASQQLDYDSTQLMLAGQREFIVSFKAREDIPVNTNITISGGLPELPGTSILMPHLNGHEAVGLVNPNDPTITPDINPDQGPVVPADDNQPDTIFDPPPPEPQ
jgi:hypothetical protein